MKVLCVNERLDYINIGILDAMREAGYNVQVLPLGEFDKNTQLVVLENMLNTFRPDYVFTPGWSVGIFDVEQFLRLIKKYNIFHVYWATEDPLHIENVSKVFVPHSNFVFTTAVECVDIYKQMGIPASPLLFGCNPKIFHKREVDPKYKHDIVLVANNYFWFSEDKNFRMKAIKDVVAPLTEGGYDIKIWGDSWTKPEYGFHVNPQYAAGYLFDYVETAKIYSSAKIVLGIQSVNNSITQTSVRTFEIMGSGAFYLTCYTPSHESLFKNHEHLVWSKSSEETIALVDYYLSHDEERETIARNGQVEVYKKHTYDYRMRELEQALQPYIGKS